MRYIVALLVLVGTASTNYVSYGFGLREGCRKTIWSSLIETFGPPPDTVSRDNVNAQIKNGCSNIRNVKTP